MEQFKLSSDSTSSLIPFSLAVPAILNGLAVKILNQNNRGVQIENGEVKLRAIRDWHLKEHLPRKT
jgi:hypothetical protein